MTNSRVSTSTGWIIATLVVVAFLTVSYIGAYYALVQRGGSSFGGPFVTYRVDGLRTIFGPAHWLDRKIRPDYWGY